MTVPLLVLLLLAQGPGELTISPGLKVDRTRGLVTLDAAVVLREGPLELLLCPKRGKEHESILAAEMKPKDFQVALLLAGATPGRPVQMDPPKPPTGQRVKIWLEIAEESGTRLVDAREWILDVAAKRAMRVDFVFTGSRIVRVPESDSPLFLGDNGEVICVANFPGSIIDVSVRSSDKNDQLTFAPFTERIPAKGTPVKVIVEPLVE